MGEDRKICVGMIAGAHGVRGLIRLRSFTEDPATIAEFDDLSDEGGNNYAIDIKTAANDFYIAALKGIENREQAEALRGTKLYVPRTALPKTSRHEYYEVDLIGLKAQDKQGKAMGVVRAVHNYGGGPFLEIGSNTKDSIMLPFTDACVPEVDVKTGSVVIDPPEGWLNKEKPPREAKPPKSGKNRSGPKPDQAAEDGA